MTDEPLAPVPLDDLRQMLATCTHRCLADDRDRALLLFLLDTGCRRAEVLALNLGDVDLGSGSVAVRRGKGGKARMTFLGAKARKALAGYLRYRRGAGLAEPLWTTTQGGMRLSYGGLREIMRRRAKAAGVPAPGLHAFRRAFALNALRAGIDLVSLQRLMGHTTLDILRRYLAQTDADLQLAHAGAWPVDRLL
ncbi:MAG: tyrosine-type recombinase/integrase [Anaerolineae bacterium]